MQDVADLLRALQARHADFLNSRWDWLSADDAKTFIQIERNIMEIRAALGRPGRAMTPDLQQCIERLEASALAEPRLSGPDLKARGATPRQADLSPLRVTPQRPGSGP
jgi:hypothetical protein